MNDYAPEVPSFKSLFISSCFAIVLAAIILVFGVLPAEYGIDLTGFGKKMGLTALAPVKKSPFTVSNSAKPISEEIAVKVVDPKRVEAEMQSIRVKTKTKALWRDTVSVIVPPMKGVEYKFYLKKDKKLAFEWQTDGAKIYFDFHGEPEGDTTGYFKSFKIATELQSSGTLTIPFAGNHGWYWKNKTDVPVKIILKTTGDYRILGLM
ncbi:MAG: hypothetical protein KAG06_08340 [Methylococcales bacterium]|nr:hypothetical protein [Methylococcales bacterium]